MKAVIDTNVLLVANGDHDEISDKCKKECIDRLNAIMGSGTVVIDGGRHLLGEYSNKISSNRQKGVGDAFLKWLHQNRSQKPKVEQVSLDKFGDDQSKEFLISDLPPDFDHSDRKFVAVANAHAEKPPIWQAADCKWLDWWRPLKAKGIVVDFLCRGDVCRFYRRKFPSKPAPALPREQ